MDKTEYCDDIEKRLREVNAFASAVAAPRPAPATPAAEQAMNQARDRARVLEERSAELLTKLASIRAAPDSEWEAARQDLDREWDKVAELRSSLS
jgi:hypothetical protein